ncbi:zinc finger protein 107 [Erpetoichthys calabaricus]|uniref:Zinc finger protein 107-like n=1 Tax=Erpetoichthys calabaricus TaxID=27687 RepID=A0A8C4TFY6_ERPCA|nr:zinc finger protein 107 [Erpetoichthys calabaricus]XP_028678694.1 zinc finger protein 107 [Erpetoichthys calabaricus]
MQQSAQKWRAYRCNKCEKCFASIEPLMAHQAMHAQEGGLLYCEKCESVFSSQEVMDQHQCTSCTYICTCGNGFGQYSELLAHMRSHDEWLPMEYISPRWENSRIGSRNEKVETNSLKPEINEPSTIKNGSANLSTHGVLVNLNLRFWPVVTIKRKYLQYQGRGGYKCGKCGWSFPSLDVLIEHHASHKKETVYGCKRCKRVIVSRMLIVRHPCKLEEVSTEDSKSPLLFRYDGISVIENFSKQEDTTLNGPNNSRSAGEVWHRCVECPMVFRRRGDLDKHKFTHSNVKLFKCQNCHKSYTRKYSLKSHKCSGREESPEPKENLKSPVTEQEQMTAKAGMESPQSTSVNQLKQDMSVDVFSNKTPSHNNSIVEIKEDSIKNNYIPSANVEMKDDDESLPFDEENFSFRASGNVRTYERGCYQRLTSVSSTMDSQGKCDDSQNDQLEEDELEDDDCIEISASEQVKSKELETCKDKEPEADENLTKRPHLKTIKENNLPSPKFFVKHPPIDGDERRFECTTCGKRFSRKYTLYLHKKNCNQRCALKQSNPEMDKLDLGRKKRRNDPGKKKCPEDYSPLKDKPVSKPPQCDTSDSGVSTELAKLSSIVSEPVSFTQGHNNQRLFRCEMCKNFYSRPCTLRMHQEKCPVLALNRINSAADALLNDGKTSVRESTNNCADQVENNTNSRFASDTKTTLNQPEKDYNGMATDDHSKNLGEAVMSSENVSVPQNNSAQAPLDDILNEHLSMVHCQFCGRGYKHKSSLCRHHMGSACGKMMDQKKIQVQSPVCCGQCGQVFNERDSFKKHLNVSTCQGMTVPAFFCEVCCKSFETSEQLKHHQHIPQQ